MKLKSSSNSSSERTLKYVFTVIIVIMILISFFSYRTFLQYGEDVRLRVHSNRMIRALQEIEVEVLNAETGHRGFQLTGNPEYLEPYLSSTESIFQKMNYLDSLSLDRSLQERRIDSLADLVKRQYSIIDEIITEVEDEGENIQFSQYEINLLTLGKQNMDNIRVLINSIESLEMEILASRISSQEIKGRILPVILMLFNVMAIGAAIYVFFYIYALLKQKNRTEDELKRRQLQLLEAEKMVNVGNWTWHFDSGEMIWSQGLFQINNKSSINYNPSFENYMDTIHPEDRKHVKETIDDAIASQKTYDITYRTRLDNGRTNHLHTIGNPIVAEDGEVEGYFGVTQNISSQKSFENKIIEQSEELKRSNEDLEQFAYVASHDLQEPLRKIRAFGDRLQSKYQDSLEDTGADYINRMQNAAERMQILINDLLTFSRVSRTNQEFEKNDLNKVLAEVMDDLESAIAESNARIDFNKLPNVMCNYLEMKRLFQNIIGNAIKFRREGEDPVIRISCTKVKGSDMDKSWVVNGNRKFYEISIRDNGIGFNEKYQDRIFNIFQRLHGRAQFKGTGIGLAICRKIVSNHEGFITARGKENEGAEFLIYLPKNLKQEIHEREEIADHLNG